MMYCPNCGKQLDPTHRFCPVCGKPVPLPDATRPASPGAPDGVYDGVAEEGYQGEAVGDTAGANPENRASADYTDNRQTIFVTQNITVVQPQNGVPYGQSGQETNAGPQSNGPTVPIRNPGGFQSVLPLLFAIFGLAVTAVSAFLGLPFFWLAIGGAALSVTGLVLASIRLRGGFKSSALFAARIIGRIGIILSALYLVLLLILFLITVIFA